MALDWTASAGIALGEQGFDWRDVARHPVSKLDTDAFTRMRIHLLAAVEAESVRFLDTLSRHRPTFRLAAARVARTEHAQRMLLKMLLPTDLSPVEKAIALEQLAVETGATLAQREKDPAVAAVLRFAVPEHVDHLYRLAALLDRTEGKDANNILQSYTDIRPGRPTAEQHRAPEDDLGLPQIPARPTASTHLHVLLALALAEDARELYVTEGPTLTEPAARMLFAELGAVAEQHVERAISLVETPPPWLDQWLLHEALELWCYASCHDAEGDPGLRDLWARLRDYELGHVRHVAELVREEDRDPIAVVPARLPEALAFASQRPFVRTLLAQERDLRTAGPHFVPRGEEARSAPGTIAWRRRVHALGIPSEAVAAGYRWVAGTELSNLMRGGVAHGTKEQ